MCKFYINRLPLMCTLCSTFRKMLSAAENSQLQKAPCDTSKNIIAPPLPLINKNNKPAKVTSYLCISLFQNSCRNSCHYLSIISPIRRKMAAPAVLSICYFPNSQQDGSSNDRPQAVNSIWHFPNSPQAGSSSDRPPAVNSICHSPNSQQDGAGAAAINY